MVDHWHNLKQNVGKPDKGKGLSRGALTAKESTKQRERQIFLAGVRAVFRYRITECERDGCQQLGTDLHHAGTKRSQHKGYRYDTGRWGADDPRNLQWLCREHHQELESNPMWTKEATDAYHDEMQRLRGNE